MCSKNIILPDAAERELIRTDLDTNLMVEASAGSGKTTSLVDRMMALIVSGKCRIGEMCAFTFTRKAAAELQGRFQLRLEKLIREESDPEKHSRLVEALQNMESGFIGTIHSFCAMLLRERPVEASLDPEFRELDDIDNNRLLKKCWAEFTERLRLEESENPLTRLDALDIDVNGLVDTYKMISGYPDVEVSREKLERPDFSDVRVALAGYLEATKDVALHEEPEKGWDPLQKIIRKAHVLKKIYKWYEDDVALIGFLSVIDKKVRITAACWKEKETRLAELERYESLRDDHIAPALAKWRMFCHSYIMDLISPAAKHFQRDRIKRSLLNFEDLLLMARGLLRDFPFVRKYFQARYRYFLIDEFQDTDPIQAEIAFFLVGKNVNEKNWRKLEPLPGSLFIVGDPKQSIYRFRRADIEIYNLVREILERSGGRVLVLSSNFRSVPGICHWANKVFKDYFGEQTPYQAAYAELSPVRPAYSSAVRRLSIKKISGNKKESIVDEDARQIAAWIRGALDGGLRLPDNMTPGNLRPARPSDFMILVMEKKYIAAYACALEIQRIPFETSGGQSIKDSEEVTMLLSLLKCIADPDDPVKLTAVIRGPLFGVSDDALYLYKKAGGLFNFMEVAPQNLPDECGDVADALNRINQWHGLTRVLPAGAAVEKIVEGTGLLQAALTSEELAQSRAGNLMKILEFIRNLSAGSVFSYTEMVGRLEEQLSSGSMEEMDISAKADNAVRIMNLHKAKGLEAAVVLLAGPVKNREINAYYHISRGEGGDEPAALGSFVATSRNGHQSKLLGIPHNWDDGEPEELRHLIAEKMRLLYVAATRARDILVISTYEEKPTESVWGEFFPYLKDDQIPEINIPISGEMPLSESIEMPQVSYIEPIECADEIGQRLAKICARGYAEEYVTAGKAAHGAADGAVNVEGEAGGMAWGRIIHRMLEAYARNFQTNLEQLARNLLVAEHMPEELIAEAGEFVRGVVKSPFWKRVEKAGRKFVEVPFCVEVPTAELHPDLADLPEKTVLTGVIDLLFEESGGWVIVDYKTDRDESLFSEKYKRQLSLYRKYWSKVTGLSVSDAFIYFIRSGNCLAVPV